MFKKFLLGLCESILIIALFAVVALGATFYRLHKAPLNVNFALETIEHALMDEGRDLTTDVGQASVFWPDLNGPLLLLLDQVDILQNGRSNFTLKRAAVSIDRASLLLGQIKPQAIILEGTSLRLIRGEDNQVRVAFDFEDKQAEAVQNVQETTPDFDPLKMFEQILSQNGGYDPLYGLKAFEIKQASIFVEDQKQHKTWMIPDFSVMFTRGEDDILLDLSYKMDGQLQPTDIQASLREDVRGYQSRLSVRNLDVALVGETLGIEEVKGRGLALQGEISAQFSNEWKPLGVDVNVAGQSGQLKISSLYDRFLDVKTLALGASYSAHENRVALRHLDLQADSVALGVSSDIMIEDKVITAPLKISGKDIGVDDLGDILPDILKDTVAETWAKKKLSVGTYTKLDVVVPLTFSKKDQEEGWETSLGEIEADFAFENLTANYSPPLKPAVELNGTGSFRDDALRIQATSGRIEDLKTNNVSVVISDMSVAGGGMADIDVHVDGPFKTLIEYIGDEPISLKEQLGFDAKEVKGNASLDVEVDFPTVKDLRIEQVKVKAKATLNDVYLPRIVKGMPLTGGPMTLVAKDGYFNLSGKGNLGKRPVDLDYTQYLDMKTAPYSQKVKAKLVADKGLRDIFGIGLEDYVAGDLPLSLEYVEKADSSAKIDVDVDLTPVEFFVSPLNYTKPLGRQGRATMTIYTVGEAIEEVSDLNIDLHDGHIKKGRLIFAKMDGVVDVTRAQLPDIKIPDNVLSVDLEQTTPHKTLIKIAAQKLDVRRYLGKGQDIKEVEVSGVTPKQNRTIISGNVDALRVSDTGIFHSSKLYADVDQSGDVHQLELDAHAGNGEIYLRYKPDPFGQLGFRLEATDAGATLRAMDLYDDMVGGTLLIEATRPPKSHINDLDGIAQIQNFKVVDAPALARLMNAMSLPGLQQLLNGGGIEFGKMKTTFKRRKKDTGTELLFSDGRTSGAEVGLTFEGKINQDTKLVDVQGTVIPLSSFNKVVGQIPIVGQILTGGGALIAATYNMERPEGGDEVKVSVNPLSALTPGILRRILFEGENPADE